VKSYWIYRLLFFACIALTVGGVAFTLSSRQRNVARADTPRPRAAALPRQPADNRPPVQRPDTVTTLASRVRITTVIPYRNEIHLLNFGDAAEDLSGWRLVSPRPSGGEDESFTFPVSTVLLPGEALVVVVGDGLDQPGEVHWRAPADVRVLDLAADIVWLVDDNGVEVSRFEYRRR
jgi:hypothetical protein